MNSSQKMVHQFFFLFLSCFSWVSCSNTFINFCSISSLSLLSVYIIDRQKQHVSCIWGFYAAFFFYFLGLHVRHDFVVGFKWTLVSTPSQYFHFTILIYSCFSLLPHSNLCVPLGRSISIVNFHRKQLILHDIVSAGIFLLPKLHQA